MRLALLRHGPTDWNRQGRIQGSIDTPLSPEGRAKMAALQLPEDFAAAVAYSSPKLRARQTAKMLGLKQVILDGRLIEQNWGYWEGLTKEEMRARFGEDAFQRAGSGRGIAFRPPGGESTGEVHARLRAFCADIAAKGSDAVAVTHAGVLRAAYALATGWDMSAPYPGDLDLKAILVLVLREDGTPTIDTLNMAFAPRA